METFEIRDDQGKTLFESTWPSSWDDLTTEQLSDVAEAMHLLQHDETAFLYALGCIGSDMPDDMIMRLDERKMVALASQHMEWVSTDLSWSDSKWPRIGWLFRSVKPGLSDVTLVRFLMLNVFDGRYLLSEDPKERKQLMRTIFSLHCSFRLVPWRNWYSGLLAFCARFLSRKTLSRVILDARAMRRAFELEYPEAFDGNGGSNKLGLEGLITGIAGDKFGSVDQAPHKMVRYVFAHVTQVIQENRKLKQK